MIDINANDLPIYLDNNKFLLVLLHQKNCNPCIRQKEVIECIESNLNIKIIGIAADSNPEYDIKQNPPGYPALIFYSNNRIVLRNSGLLEKTKLLEFINTGINYE